MPKAPKIQPNKVIHPNSRKAWQKARHEHHESKKELRRTDSNVKLGAQGEKMKWFKDNLSLFEEKNVYDNNEVKTLVEKYLARFDDERDQIAIVNSIKGRHGRMHASRDDNIRFIQEKETIDFNSSGLEIPDLFNKENVDYFRNWNGELRYLCNIKTKIVTSAGPLFS